MVLDRGPGLRAGVRWGRLVGVGDRGEKLAGGGEAPPTVNPVGSVCTKPAGSLGLLPGVSGSNMNSLCADVDPEFAPPAPAAVEGPASRGAPD